MAKISDSLFESSVTFANSAAQNSQQNCDIDLPGAMGGQYLISISNPSASALTIKVALVEKFGGLTKYCVLTSIAAPAGYDGACALVANLMIASGARLIVSNDTALGGGGGFTGLIRVRRLN